MYVLDWFLEEKRQRNKIEEDELDYEVAEIQISQLEVATLEEDVVNFSKFLIFFAKM